MNNTQPRFKAATTKQLADLFGISEKMMRAWLEPIQPELGPRIGHYFTPKQVEIIHKHVAASGLLIFGLSVNASEAVAGNNEAYAFAAGSNNGIVNDYGSVFQNPVDTSTPIFYPALFVIWLSAQYYHMVFNIKSLIERFIDTPENRRLAMMRSQSTEAKVFDVVRISYIIMQVTVACMATVFAGYWVGKIIFR